MRVANLGGRAVIVHDGRAVDVAELSRGSIGPSMASVYRHWDETRALVARIHDGAGRDLDDARVGCPVPEPRQVFAIGLNYRAHAAESGMEVPEVPATFTKYPSSLAGPVGEIVLVGDRVDWEVELVVVLARECRDVAEADAWDHVAGLTVGQDISDRTLQIAAGRQFSLGKSRTGFGPMGPVVVSADELDDPDDLALGCSVNGEVVQSARTSDMVFSVPKLIAELSSVLTLYPGDVIFTGTPAGVGMGRTPQRFLRAGDVLETWVDGVGRMRHVCA